MQEERHDMIRIAVTLILISPIAACCLLWLRGNLKFDKSGAYLFWTGKMNSSDDFGLESTFLSVNYPTVTILLLSNLVAIALLVHRLRDTTGQ